MSEQDERGDDSRDPVEAIVEQDEDLEDLPGAGGGGRQPIESPE